MKSAFMDFAVIFDMDGVLVNNYEYHRRAWEMFLQMHNIPVTGNFKSGIFGGTNPEHLEYFFGRKLSTLEFNEFEESKESIYRTIYEPHIKPVNGLIPFLTCLQEWLIPLALATSSPRINVDFVLEKTGTRKFFNAILDSSSVVKGKPDPEIYLKAAGELNYQPKHCIVFEDSLNGIMAAKRAGAKVIALTTTHLANDLPRVELIIEDYTDLKIQDLENIL